MQREITEETLLLDETGRLIRPGYATSMRYIYNREQARKNLINLKEWIFYQFIKDRWAVQMTIGHVSYMCSVTATLLNLDTGAKREIGSMKAFYIPALDKDPQGNTVNEYRAKDFWMQFRVLDDRRILRFKGRNSQYGDVEFFFEIANDVNNEKMVIATPFDKPHQFYLNYKENYYRARGFARFDDFRVDMDGATGLIDWGRGIWPYSHEWYWGSLSAQVGGEDFGFNIGWGFGNLTHATENMFFYRHKAYKLGRLSVDWSGYMQPWHLRDDEGRMELDFHPIYDNYTYNHAAVVNTHCNQVYGRFDGHAVADGERIGFHGLLGFIEHAVNRW